MDSRAVCSRLAKGAEVFEWGSRVMKLYPSAAAKEHRIPRAAIHAAVEALGLPVPTVWSVQQIDGRWYRIDLVSGASFADQMWGDAGAIPQYLQILTRLTCTHSCPSSDVFSDLKVWLATSIARAALLDEPRSRFCLMASETCLIVIACATAIFIRMKRLGRGVAARRD